MTRLRVACVGTGFIAGRHLSALSTMPEVEVVAVADAVPGRADEVAAGLGARAYDDGLALLATEDLDAVWLCVPPSAHGPLERAAVERGVPVFVEKPVAVDLSTASDIARAVRDSSVVAAVGYHWRHLDVVRQAAAALDGAPVHLASGDWLDRTPAAPWWSRRAESGGQLVEQTTHLFDLARLLVGEVTSVSGAEVDRAAEADVPLASAVLLRFASGAVGTMTSTRVLTARHRVALRLVADGVVVEVLERSLSDHELRITTSSGTRVVTSDEDAVLCEDRQFVDVLLGRADAVTVPYDEALRTHALVCAADDAARAAGTVEVPRG